LNVRRTTSDNERLVLGIDGTLFIDAIADGGVGT
jgi:hypothetical protein